LIDVDDGSEGSMVGLYTFSTSAAEDHHSAAEIIFFRKGSHSLMTELL
jgi:hypothetical protein